MTTISASSDVMTLINVFTVEPANQRRLVELLTEAIEVSLRRAPGFVSASLHRSTDGTKVTMYAQWRSIDDLATQLICPVGQISEPPVILLVQPLLQNHFCFSEAQIKLYDALSRLDKRGGSRSSRNAGRDAVDARNASDEGAILRTAKPCGPGAPTLALSWRKQFRRRRWQESPVTGKSAG
jgi:quinol monooxygenase YgiN